MTDTPAPPFATRGLIEGFYGPPWSWNARHRMLDFLAGQGFNAYLYAPKNDPIHRNRWREPYTSLEWREFAGLNAHAREKGIRLIFGLSALGFRYSDPADLRVLQARVARAREVGISDFCLLLDDLPARFEHGEDARRFGSLARAQAWLANRLAEGVPGSFSFVPTEYHGVGESGYLRELGEALNPATGVFWSGPQVCSPTLGAADLAGVTAGLRRRPIIWDNVPVNDLDMHCDPHLTPLKGRSADLAGAVSGYFANASPAAELSKPTLHTVGAYLRDPAGYDPAQAEREAARALTGTPEEAAALLQLSDLARRGPLHPGAALHHGLWPALDGFWAARGGPPARAGGELDGRPEPQPVESDEAPLRRAALELELAAETLAHLGNLDLRRELAPWTRKLAGWARVLKCALAALDHPHDERAREYVLEALPEVRANLHWVAGDTLDQFARRCVWAAEALAAMETAEVSA